MDKAAEALDTVCTGAKAGLFAEDALRGGVVPEGGGLVVVEHVEEVADDGCGGFNADKRFAAVAVFIAEPDADDVIWGPAHAPGVGIVIGGAGFPRDIKGCMGEWTAEGVGNKGFGAR